MVGLVQTIHGHVTWLNYHIEALSGPPEEIDKNMVDEDRTIPMRETMNMHVLSNIRSFNNQGSLIMFTCTDHQIEQTHNTFLVTSYESRSSIVAHGLGKEHCIYSELFLRVNLIWGCKLGQL